MTPSELQEAEANSSTATATATAMATAAATASAGATASTSSTSMSKGGASRVSLACLSCRTRHIRCDATKPICKRCEEDGKECNYTKSRRGGLDRAALAARRERLARQSPSINAADMSESVSVAGEQHHLTPSSTEPGSGSAMTGMLNDPRDPSLAGSASSCRVLDLPDAALASSASGLGVGMGMGVGGMGVGMGMGMNMNMSMRSGANSNSSNGSGGGGGGGGLANDPFVDLYYKCFHSFHPFVLPQHRLLYHAEDPVKAQRLRPVISCLRQIGSMYSSHPDQTGQLAQQAASDIAEAKATSPLCPFLCQAHLLQSVVLYWSGAKPQAQMYMRDAVGVAVTLGMARQEFANAHSDGDPVLAESWRRTWWQLYIVDANYAAIKRDTEFPTRDVPVTVDLPCEEREYNSGVIPRPSSLADFDSREFSSDNHVYSSFAYLVGAVRGVNQILAATPPDRKTSPPLELVEAVDAMTDGWLLLLPECKRPLMNRDGEIDEQLFTAHMGMHAYLVGIHRPYSNLLFHPLEKITSCFVCPPESQPADQSTSIHTLRCLASIEAQIRIMTLPKRPFCHSPFTLCTITTGTIPFLSACKFLLNGPKLAIAREQIRLTIGCLKTLGEIWPQGAKTVREIQTIAREVLNLDASSMAQRGAMLLSNNTSGFTSSQRSPISQNGSQNGSQNSSLDDLLYPDTIESISSCWDVDNQQVDMNLWFASY